MADFKFFDLGQRRNLETTFEPQPVFVTINLSKILLTVASVLAAAYIELLETPEIHQ